MIKLIQGVKVHMIGRVGYIFKGKDFVRAYKYFTHRTLKKHKVR